MSIESWMTSFGKDDYARTHSHATCDICGVYYYKTEMSEGDLLFEELTELKIMKNDKIDWVCFFSWIGLILFGISFWFLTIRVVIELFSTK